MYVRMHLNTLFSSPFKHLTNTTVPFTGLNYHLDHLDTGCRRSRVVTFTAIRLRGLGFKPRPGQTFENENFCFRRPPAVVKACHPCRGRLIMTPPYNWANRIVSSSTIIRTVKVSGKIRLTPLICCTLL